MNSTTPPNPGQTPDTKEPQTVKADSFLTLHYRLSGTSGDVINTFGGQPATISLGTGELSLPMENCLIGMAEGQRQVFTLGAGEAFGTRQHIRLSYATSRAQIEEGCARLKKLVTG